MNFVAVVASLLAAATWTPQPNNCPSIGCAWYPNSVYIAPGSPHYVWIHEAGHLFDFQRMDTGARNRFQTIIRDHREWRAEPFPPGEKFAEAFRLCALSPTRLVASYFVAYDYFPTLRQHRAVCRLIEHVQDRYDGLQKGKEWIDSKSTR